MNSGPDVRESSLPTLIDYEITGYEYILRYLMEFKCTSLLKLPYSMVTLRLCKSILLLNIYLYVMLTI